MKIELDFSADEIKKVQRLAFAYEFDMSANGVDKEDDRIGYGILLVWKVRDALDAARRERE